MIKVPELAQMLTCDKEAHSHYVNCEKFSILINGKFGKTDNYLVSVHSSIKFTVFIVTLVRFQNSFCFIRSLPDTRFGKTGIVYVQVGFTLRTMSISSSSLSQFCISASYQPKERKIKVTNAKHILSKHMLLCVSIYRR